jgi:hypothetical protein
MPIFASGIGRQLGLRFGFGKSFGKYPELLLIRAEKRFHRITVP